jgi:hypothetical protein
MRPQSNLRGAAPLIPLRNMILQASSIQLNGSELNRFLGPSIASFPKLSSALGPQCSPKAGGRDGRLRLGHRASRLMATGRTPTGA